MPKYNQLVTASIDVESTGTNPSTDRIISLGAEKRIPNDDGKTWALIKKEWKINPGIPIPKEASDVHGITDDMVTDWPTFDEVGSEIWEFLDGVKVYVGFNIFKFDLLIISEEFSRNGFHELDIDFPQAGVLIIDAGNIFKKKEARTLEAAVEKYVHRKHEGAHSALTDAIATGDVLDGQVALYADLAAMDVTELAKFSEMDGMLDYAGKLGLDKDGQAVYRIGEKTRGVRVKDDLGMAEWMLSRQFSENTKNHLRRLMIEAQAEYEARFGSGGSS